MYYDDFLMDCKMNNNDSGKFYIPENSILSREIMSNYLDNKFLIFVNQKQLPGEIEDMKILDGELNINLIFKSVKKPGSVTIRNLIMTRLYSDQANMMIIKINDFEEGIKFSPEKTEKTFIIN